MLKYNEIVQFYYASQQIVVPPSCNGYLAVNRGDMLFFVNNFPIYPNPNWATNKLAGESTGLIGNVGEIFTGTNGTISLRLDATFGGATPAVCIVFKYYTEENC